MNPIAELLLEQIAAAQAVGRQILALSGLGEEGVIYAFATADTLVVNCRDCATTWRFDEEQDKLERAIAHSNSSIKTIHIEKAGIPFYCW